MPQRFSEKILEHFQDPLNQGILENPDGTGVSGNPGRGPYFVIQIQCTENVVTEARFQSHSCGVTVASGSVLTEMIKDSPVEACLQITSNELANALDGVPVDKMHVPEFALAALRMALDEVSYE